MSSFDTQSQTPGVLAGMNILVTGATGFIGSHLVPVLQDWGANVTGCSLSAKADTIQCDLTITADSKAILGKQPFDCVVHLASALRRSTSREGNPDAAMAESLVGQMHDGSRLVYLTTADEYDGSHCQPISESATVAPVNRYGSQKLETRRLLEQKCSDRNINLQVMRPFSVFGSGQPNYMFLALILESIRTNTPFTYSAHLKVRDYLYISDLCDAIALLVLKQPQLSPDVYNVGTGQATSLEHLVTKILEQTGSHIEISRSFEIGNNDPHYLVACADRFRQLTGWSARVSLDQGLANLLVQK